MGDSSKEIATHRHRVPSKPHSPFCPETVPIHFKLALDLFGSLVPGRYDTGRLDKFRLV